MILSKPLTTTAFYRLKPNLVLAGISTSLLKISKNSSINNNRPISNGWYKIDSSPNHHPDLLLVGKKFVPILTVIKRDFKQPNSYVNHKEGYMGSTLEKFFIYFAVFFFSTYLIDYKYIWLEIVPAEIREPILKAKESIQKTARKYLRKADSLAKNGDQNTEANDQPQQQQPPVEGKIFDHSKVAKKLMAVFKFDPTEYNPNGFRNRRIVEYENRLRLYSNPDKIFRYFATIKIVYPNKETEIFMTPDDFLRSLTPNVRQPDGLGLDQFQVIDLGKSTDGGKPFEMTSLFIQQLSSNKPVPKYHKLKSDSIFYKLSKDGLINFPDFLFLLTVISVSPRNFEIAFRMFDFNGDGQVEYEEFAKVQNAILVKTSVGKKMGKEQIRYRGKNSAISKYFFGSDLKKRMNIKEFLQFQETIHRELLTLEYERKNPDPETGKIHETDFADLLVAYALLPEKKRVQMRNRVKKRFSGSNSIGITLEDYLHFFRFLQCINDVDIALAIYNMAGASIDQATLKHAAKTVAQVDLNDHLVDVVFTAFDDNEDGQLSHKEFVAIMKERLRRGLSKPKDTGFMAIIYFIWSSLISFDF